MPKSSKLSRYKTPIRKRPLVEQLFQPSTSVCLGSLVRFFSQPLDTGDTTHVLHLILLGQDTFRMRGEIGVKVFINGGIACSEFAIQWSEYETTSSISTISCLRAFSMGASICNVFWQSLYHDEMASVLCSFHLLRFYTCDRV